MIATVCLLAFMIVATITDVRQQKIYNWTTYTGIAVALVLAGLATAFDWSDLAEIGIKESIAGFLACGLIMLICYVMFQIGGGDVKLLAMVGAYLGPQLGIETLLWTFVLGGAAAVVILIWKIGLVKLVSRLVQQMAVKLSIGSWDALTEEEKKQLQLPLYLAPSALVAAVVVRFSLMEKIADWMNG